MVVCGTDQAMVVCGTDHLACSPHIFQSLPTECSDWEGGRLGRGPDHGCCPALEPPCVWAIERLKLVLMFFGLLPCAGRCSPLLLPIRREEGKKGRREGKKERRKEGKKERRKEGKKERKKGRGESVYMIIRDEVTRGSHSERFPWWHGF